MWRGKAAEATSREGRKRLVAECGHGDMKRRAAGSDRWPRSQSAASAVASKRPRGAIEAHGSTKSG